MSGSSLADGAMVAKVVDLYREGANDWTICRLVPTSDNEERRLKESLICVLNALEARMSLMIKEGGIGAVGTEDDAAMGYYLVRWLSEPYTLRRRTPRGWLG